MLPTVFVFYKIDIFLLASLLYRTLSVGSVIIVLAGRWLVGQQIGE